MFNKEIVRYFLLQFFYLSNKKERKWRKFDKCVFQKLKKKFETFFCQTATNNSIIKGSIKRDKLNEILTFGTNIEICSFIK
jgi:hypothetical protein